LFVVWVRWKGWQGRPQGKKADIFRMDLLANSENRHQFLMGYFWSRRADIRHFCACGSFVRRGGGSTGSPSNWVRWKGWQGRQMGEKCPF
jgi:hypothetical protein